MPASPSPTRVEDYATVSHAQERLTSVGASHKPEHSSRTRWVYWVPRTRSWVTAERASGGIRLTWWASCPC